ncbi:hypothetical protein ANCDUO_03277 [Ancylostoma duodenale]|uniref:Uncharacterized protein n=1 Tax=Ancylostoma duodenale TaxID=51022 RepID=A0A0C2GY22_9BILA|nr:hypothetical protein ANCDUO_03277 [Ancylostoma duodenale]
MQVRKIRYGVIVLTETRRYPAFCHGKDEIEAFNIYLGKFYWEDHTFYKKGSPEPVINAVDNITEEYDRPVQNLRDSAKKTKGSRAIERLLSYQTPELIRQRGVVRKAHHSQLTSKLAKRCRETIKEDLEERKAEVLAETAETGKSIRNARRDIEMTR